MKVRVSKRGVRGWPWIVQCGDCYVRRQAEGTVNTAIGWRSWEAAMWQAWSHLKDYHGPVLRNVPWRD